MYTLTCDDRELVVTLMLRILKELDPEGTHLGATEPAQALALAGENRLDVAFLDVEMPGETNGLDLGKQLRKLYPQLDIVIITGHSEYALDAFDLDASGYLLKPLTKEAVAHQLSVRRFGQAGRTARDDVSEQNTDRDSNQNGGREGDYFGDRRRDIPRVHIRCFGTFEIFCDGVPLDFSYSKSKELLACLVDRQGAICSNDTLIGCLWPDEPMNEQTKARLRKYVKDLKDTLAGVGAEDILRHQKRIGVGLDISKIDCDYYHYLNGDTAAAGQFKGRYMIQYAFAEETRAQLNRHE